MRAAILRPHLGGDAPGRGELGIEKGAAAEVHAPDDVQQRVRHGGSDKGSGIAIISRAPHAP